MEYLHKELDLRAGDAVEVTLAGNPANVLLLDPTNFEAYTNRKQYRYFGGYFTQSPAVIEAPRSGLWHLIVDLGGGPGTVTASVRVVERAVV